MQGFDVDRVFMDHPPSGTQQERYIRIGEEAKHLAYVILNHTPASAEQTLAFRALQQAVMWAHAAIALNEDVPV